MAALLAALLYALLFYVFPNLPRHKHQASQREPAVSFQASHPTPPDGPSDFSALSPLLLALPSRVFQYFPSENIPPGKPPLDAPPPALIRAQPPRETSPSLEDWITRLGREQNRPPSLWADPKSGRPSYPDAPGWSLYDGLEGLHADLTPILQLKGLFQPPTAITLWLSLDQTGNVRHLLIESTGLNKDSALKLDRAMRECMFSPTGKDREGRITIRL